MQSVYLVMIIRQGIQLVHAACTTLQHAELIAQKLLQEKRNGNADFDLVYAQTRPVEILQ